MTSQHAIGPALSVPDGSIGPMAAPSSPLLPRPPAPTADHLVVLPAGPVAGAPPAQPVAGAPPARPVAGARPARSARGPAGGAVLSADQARRIAIAAQRLAAPAAPRVVHRGHLRRLVDDIGILQIDSVNVLARAHLLPVFSRLGPYPTSVLEGAAWPVHRRDRMLIESWAHMASLIPVEREPLLRWRQRRYEAYGVWGQVKRLQAEHPGFLDVVRDTIADLGPSSAGDVEKALEAPGRGVAGWWEWSVTKVACEHLFATGVIGVAGRRGFERIYDLTERVLPPSVLAVPTPAEADAQRELVALAARAHGIGTVADLADYHRMGSAETRRALADLVEDGRVLPVTVRGWEQPAFLHARARVPRAVGGSALLSPFDPLVWRRERTERIFGMHYRIEIYTPAAKRVYGYYVLPFLVGDRLVGRFDLKADRAAGRLLVQAAWLEPGADPAATAVAAAAELGRLAAWLGLGEVMVAPRGTLAHALSRHSPIRPAG